MVTPTIISLQPLHLCFVAALLVVGASAARANAVPVFRYDAALQKVVAVPVSLGAVTDQVYLTVYGTGIRGTKAQSATWIFPRYTPGRRRTSPDWIS